MKTILVATDFSVAASNAANYGTDMAIAMGADIFIISVVEIPAAVGEIPIVINEGEMINDAEKNMANLKEELSRKVNGKMNIRTEVTFGLFFEHLEETCKKIDPYAVVIGARGKSGVERIFFGAHAAYTMRHLRWPAIAVPLDSSFSSIKKIGFACDFDEVVETTPINEIKTLVNDFHAELHVINLGRKKEFDPEIVFQSALMQEMLISLKPEYHFLTSQDVDEGIMTFIEMQHIDLLIVLPKRHRLIDKIMHKSHTKQFILRSDVPVLSLHQ